MFDVAGVGTNSVDEFLQLADGPAAVLRAGKSRVLGSAVAAGGQTATTLSACAAWGLTCRYVGAIGSDANGVLIREALQSRGIDLADAVACDAPNRRAVILVDPDGHRTVFWHRSERLTVPPTQISPRSIDARIVHVDDDDLDLALCAARVASRAGTPVTSDIEHPSPRVEELIAAVTYPIFAEMLPARLTGEGDAERALRKLRRLNAGVLCMTLGARGAIALEGDRLHVAPAFAVRAADNTGAGDVFRAGFVYGVLRAWDVPQILRFANAAAAMSCTRPGAIPSVPDLSDVRQLLQDAAQAGSSS